MTIEKVEVGLFGRKKAIELEVGQKEVLDYVRLKSRPGKIERTITVLNPDDVQVGYHGAYEELEKIYSKDQINQAQISGLPPSIRELLIGKRIDYRWKEDK